MQRVPINGRKRLVAVDIGESESGKLYAYNVNTEGVHSFENKKKIFERNYARRKNKIGDAVLLPSSKDSVKGLHGSQYLLRFVAKSLPKGKSQGKLWVLGTGVLCCFPLMTKQKDPVSYQGASGLIPTCRGPQTLQRRRPMTKH